MGKAHKQIKKKISQKYAVTYNHKAKINKLNN